VREIEDGSLYKNLIATGIDIDEDCWFVGSVTMKQRREGRDPIRINIWRINSLKAGGERWIPERIKWDGSSHINPAALRSLCNLASSAQACASRTSGSEEGLLSSTLFSPWLILAAVSAEIIAGFGGFGSSSREREKPCRSIV